MIYRGYALHWTSDGVTVRWRGELVDTVSKMSVARTLVDQFHNAQ